MNTLKIVLRSIMLIYKETKLMAETIAGRGACGDIHLVINRNNEEVWLGRDEEGMPIGMTLFKSIGAQKINKESEPPLLSEHIM